MTEKIRKKALVPGFFSGEVDNDLLIPFPQIGDEEREEMNFILDTVKKFTTEKIDAEEIDRNHKIPDSVKEGMAELGLWGLIIPEEYGGFEQSEFTYNKVMEIITGTCGATSVMFGGHLSIGLKAILLYGNEQQKAKYFPELASGEKLSGFALTEPDAGSDAQSLKTNAVLSDDGSHYILNGKKQWITNGGFAEVFTVFAKVKEKDSDVDSSKITAFIVERAFGGLTNGKEEDKMGICGSSTTPLYLDNVKVPVENVLGEVGGGFNIAMGVLNTGRHGLGAGCVGSAKSIMKDAINFAHHRKQFKQKIADFEMVEEKFANMAIRIFTGESMVYLTTCLKEQYTMDVSVEAAICKVFCSETLWSTTSDCLQIAGGNGFMKEYPFERFLRDARINMIFEGANDILLMMIAVIGLQRPSVMLKKHIKLLPENAAERMKKIQELSEELSSTFVPMVVDGLSPELKEQLEAINEMTRQLHATVTKAVLINGRAIRDMQYIQKRLANSAISIFGMISNMLRVENLLKRGHQSSEKSLKLSRAFIRIAQRDIITNLDDVLLNHDEETTSIAKMIYAAEQYPLDILDY